MKNSQKEDNLINELKIKCLHNNNYDYKFKNINLIIIKYNI